LDFVNGIGNAVEPFASPAGSFMLRTLRFIAALFFLLTPHHAQAAFDSADLASAGPLTVVQVTPSGEDVPATRQLTIEFNRPVVAVGKMDRDKSEIPVTIEPVLDCQWRWITTRTLACILDEKAAMRQATTYKITITPGIKTLDGTTLAEVANFDFITARPELNDTEFKEWKAPTMPLFQLRWNQPVTKQSATSHIYILDQNKKRIAVRLRAYGEKRVLPHWLFMPGEKTDVAVSDEDGEAPDDQLTYIKGQEARRIWIAEPVTALPPDATVTLHVEPGIVSAVGPMPSVQNEDVLSLDTFPAFSFHDLRCEDLANEVIQIKPGETQKSACDPLAPIALEFSTPVSRHSASLNTAFAPALTGKKSGVRAWGDTSEENERVTSEHEAKRLYSVYLPAGLKAAQKYSIRIAGQSDNWWVRLKHWAYVWLGKPMPEGDALRDKFGRPLPGPVAIDFATDHRAPNALLEYWAAVLEKNTDSDVPMYVDNIKQVKWGYTRQALDATTQGLSFATPVAAVQDIQFQLPVGVRDMIGKGESGALYGRFTTDPRQKDIYQNHALFAEVTPFQIHAKIGHFNSLVWVTDLTTGQPVANADVVIYKDELAELNGPAAGAITAHTDDDGIATLPGTEQIDPDLTVQHQSDNDQHFFIRVSKDKDMALLPILSQFEIDGYRSSGQSIYARNKKKFGHMVTWGTSAEGIYHPGDTLQYKVYVRNQDNATMTPPPQKTYWLDIVDPTGKVVHTEHNITLSDFGTFSGEFTTGKKAAVGWYSFRLKANFSDAPQIGNSGGENCGGTRMQDATNANDSDDSDDDDDSKPQTACEGRAEFTWEPLRVLVSDFTPVPFEVRNELSGDLFRPGDKVVVDTTAKLHSGGPYTLAQVRVTAILTPATFEPHNPAVAGFTFGTELQNTEPQQLFETSAALDDKGEAKATFPIDDRKIYYGRLMVESAVQDDRGKNVAHQSYADYVGVDRFVGVKLSGWFFSAGSEIPVDYIVTDERGNPVPHVSVKMTLERQDRSGARVKSAGDAYTPETDTVTVTDGACTGTSDATAQTCKLKPTKAGDYTLRATVTDSKGRTQETTEQLWITGSDFVMWDDGSDTTLNIVADKESYHIGDTAHFLVKNPYPGAKALVTVERYGVMDRFVMTLKDSASVIDLPIKPDYMPGFYLSVDITSPRVEQPPPQAGQIDLGKPTFRLGYVKVPVRDAYKEIDIKAQADKDVYRPGDKVHVHIDAKARYPKPGEPVELAVAVVDEAVFDLLTGGKDYYDPYKGFYTLDSLDLRNYSLLTRLIGRQKFEKKGANPGGDGGSSLNMRSIFKYVTYWNPSMKADADGKADIDFTVPDNLTGWHIFVLADTPTDRFGLGEANFKVNRPTEVRPEMPNQVSESDSFEARFSVMNRTKDTRTVKVTVSAEGDIDPALPARIEKMVTLKPYERGLVALPVKAGKVAETRDTDGEIRFAATAGDAIDTDGMRHTLAVHKLRSLEVGANYGTTTADKIEEPVQFPDNIYPDVGSLSVTATPSVIGNLAGAFKYLRDYPFPCWEQVLTRGVMAAHFKTLHAYLPKNLTWPGADALPDQTLAMAADYQAPNGGMTYFIPNDSHVDPYLSAYTALAFTWLRHDGYQIPKAVEDKLHDYLLDMLRHDQMPTFYSEGMSSTVRAVALAALADSTDIDKSDIDRYAPHLKEMSLFGKAHFALAASKVPGAQQNAAEAVRQIMNQANETGGKYIFSEVLDDSYSRILSSPMRENCAVLDAMVVLGETPAVKNLVGDVPYKLVRTVTQTRGGRDHWENTQENMFCMNALTDFSKVYEKDKPAMHVEASLDGKPIGQTDFNSVRDPQATFDKPIEAADVGRKATMTLNRTGTGRVYYATHLSYAPRVGKDDGTDAGIEIHREYSLKQDGKWTLLPKPYAVKQGDLVRIDLYVSLPAARNFVVVDDPVPGGFEPVNADFATASKVDAAQGAYQTSGGSFWFKYNDWNDYNLSFWSFNHKELLHNAARFYADYLPAGNYHLSYMAQAIGAGDFAIMPTMAQEMYDPDVYGKTGFDHLNVGSNLPKTPVFPPAPSTSP
jgi:uncharacterized protein YfaS (alpha-2-macroglobulin family)